LTAGNTAVLDGGVVGPRDLDGSPALAAIDRLSGLREARWISNAAAPAAVPAEVAALDVVVCRSGSESGKPIRRTILPSLALAVDLVAAATVEARSSPFIAGTLARPGSPRCPSTLPGKYSRVPRRRANRRDWPSARRHRLLRRRGDLRADVTSFLERQRSSSKPWEGERQRATVIS